MDDLIVVLILTAIISLIVFYLVKRKKQGKGCIGCPYADKCNSQCDKRR
ncbi:MAG: FeoB-associated Cys-rich membrane protein [Acutalibacteraceae bacterium]|nr:FeoB-associated Cys-rich membrane protein [Acutalibacteraceae bacterium]